MSKTLKILGIDPGLESTGYGLIRMDGNHLSYLSSGTIVTKPKTPLAERLNIIHIELSDVVKKHDPQEVALEETFVNRNAMSSLMLGHARAAAMLAVSLANVPLSEYAATLVKKSVVGTGKADKQQVLHMVKQLLPGAACQTSHEADALAVAICHVSHRTLIAMRHNLESVK